MLYIEDRRGESGRAERRKRTSALSADFTPAGAQAFFDYHQQQKEQEHERSARQRSEEHTSELQSRGHLVCRLLLEKKKKQTTYTKADCQGFTIEGPK